MEQEKHIIHTFRCSPPSLLLLLRRVRGLWVKEEEALLMECLVWLSLVSVRKDTTTSPTQSQTTPPYAVALQMFLPDILKGYNVL